MLQRVFVDSNVLFSRTTRDWLFLLRNETGGMFQLTSSIDVVSEVVRAVRRARPMLDGGVTKRLHDSLLANLDEVVDDFDATIVFRGSDPDDRHVHAASMSSGATMLLTSNERDFGATESLPYEVYRPDDFFVLVDDGAPTAVSRVSRMQAAYWRSRAEAGVAPSSADIGEALVRAACPRFASRVRAHLR